MEEVIENLNIRPLKDLEEALNNLPHQHFCSYYDKVFESMLNLLEEVLSKKPCGYGCDRERLRIIKLAHAANLTKSMQETFVIFNPDSGKVFREPYPQYAGCISPKAVGNFEELFAEREHLPTSCNAYISEINKKVTSEINKANCLVVGLALNYLRLFKESYRSAKILSVYGNIEGGQHAEWLSEGYWHISKKCLDSLLILPLPKSLKERIIPICANPIFQLPIAEQKYLSP